MAGSMDWKKAQCERLEEERKKELGLRSTWWSGQTAKWEDEQKRKEEAEGWAWGSWWWGDNQWGNSRWGWHGTGTWGSYEGCPPEPIAKPTASAHLLAIENFEFPNRNHGEDLTAIRAAAITPVSFVPQRHVTMALGRPVVVLSWI